MTDTNQAGTQEAAGSYATEGENADFKSNFDAFMNMNLGDTPEEVFEEAPPADTPPSQDGTGTTNEEPTSVASSTPATPTQEAQGTPPTETVAGEPEVAPALLAEMMLGQGTSPAPAAVETPSTPPSSTPTEEGFKPFGTFQIPEPIMAALFEAEDPKTRHDALVSLLSSFGNAITSAVEDRFTASYENRLVTTLRSKIQDTETRVAINSDFYGEYPELAPYIAYVQRAGEVYAKHNPNATYGSARDEIAKLAFATLKSAGLLASGPLPPRSKRQQKETTPAVKPKAATPPVPNGNGFEAGSVRPGGIGSKTEFGPGDLLDELSTF
jgi:hypothetical protein